MNERYVKVEGHENLYRDLTTGAIINKNKLPQKSFTKEFNTVISDINNLKDEISEIKSLLKSIVENGIRT
jgi:hypothetical protein